MEVSAPAVPIVPASAPAPSRGHAVFHFFLDLGLAVVIFLGASFASATVWAFWRGWQVYKAADGTLAAPAAMEQIGAPGALAQMLIALIGMLTAALLVYFLRRRASGAELARGRAALARPATWGWIALTGVGAFVASSGLSWLGEQIGIRPVPTNLSLVEEGMTGFPLLMVVFAVFLAPAYEELLFRRVLFGRLWAAGLPWLGVLLSSAAFALVHELPGVSSDWPGTLQLWLLYGLMGAAFAWVYRHTGTLWAAIAAHSLNNALALVLMKMADNVV